jgi:hypothetical protein
MAAPRPHMPTAFGPVLTGDAGVPGNVKAAIATLNFQPRDS